MTPAPDPAAGERRRLLRLVAAGGARLVRDGAATAFLAPGVGARAVSAAAVEAAIAAGLVARAGADGLALTAAGLAALRRALVALPEAADEAPRGAAAAMPPAGAGRDPAESPLAWLCQRRGRDGKALIAPHQFDAGERLRADFTYGGLSPRTTMDWSSFLGGRGSGSRGPGGEIADTTLAARHRVRRALDAVGPELAGILLDVCCFLKGLETVERERGWPARSAKIVLVLALDRLARHYGLDAAAAGRATGIRAWGSADFRPRIG